MHVLTRARQGDAGGALAARPVYQLRPEAQARLETPGRPALEPGPEIHLHLNALPDQLATILQHHIKEG